MTEHTRSPQHVAPSDHTRSPHPEQVWDRFVDELDRRGQAGSAADVLTPTTLTPDAPSGKRFADLSRVEIDMLAKIGSSLGRRGDVVKTIWQQTLQRRRPQKAAKGRPGAKR
jgi:hypothetical protein